MSRKTWLVLIALVILVSAAGAYWYWRAPGSRKKADYLTAPVQRGSLSNTVSATGTLQAVVTVQVGSQITGTVETILADFNSIVKAGQVLARIDDSTYRASLLTAKADVQAARVDKLDKLRVLDRNRELSEKGVVSSRDLEAAQAAYDKGIATLEQTDARVRIAEVNLEHTVIKSPIDGVVVARSVDVGQTVSASLSAPTLFLIANDLAKMQVVAAVDEADIGAIGSDTHVYFTVDSFPGERFDAVVRQIRLNPTTTQNVVTYSAILDVDNSDLRLRPGMTTTISFVVAEAEDTLKIANAALRFWPEDVPREKEAEILKDVRGNPTGATGGKGERPSHRGEWAGRNAAGRATGPAAQTRPAEVVGQLPGYPLLPSPEGEIRFPPPRRIPPRWRVVWVPSPSGSTPTPKRVKIGITDGVASQILDGELREGDTVITGLNVPSQSASGPAGRSPFGGMGGPPRGMGGGGGRR